MLNPATFLQVTLLELGTLFAFETQARSAQGGVHFMLDSLTICLFAVTHYFPLFWSHLHPAFGVSLEYFSIFRRHCLPAITQIIWIRSVPRRRRRHSMDVSSWRLRFCQFGADDQ